VRRNLLNASNFPIFRRPCPPFACRASAASAWANLWSAYRRKISPRTGVENSDGLRFEFAHN
jgi:hypothetical protein